MGDFERVTQAAGHRWEHADLFMLLGGLTPYHAGVEERWGDPQKAKELDELVGRIGTKIQEFVLAKDVDENTVVAVDAVSSFVPFSRMAEVLEHASSSVPGRLLSFLPRPEEDGPSEFLSGTDGWRLLKETLNRERSGA